MGADPINEVRINNLEKQQTKCEIERLKNEAELYNELKEVRTQMSTAIENMRDEFGEHKEKTSDSISGIQKEIQKARTKFYAFWLSTAAGIIVSLGGVVLWFVNYQFTQMTLQITKIMEVIEAMKAIIK